MYLSKQKLNFLLSIVILVALGFFIGKYRAEFARVGNIDVWSLVGISIITLATFVLLGLKNKILLNHFGVQLNRREWLGLGIVNTFWNHLVVQGGMIARAFYLKKYKNFPYQNFTAIAIAAHLVSTAFFVFICLLIFVVFFTQSPSANLLILAVICLTALSACVGLLLSRPTAKRPFWEKFFHPWRKVSYDKAVLARLVAVEFWLVLFYVFRLALVGEALGYQFSWLVYFVLAIVINISLSVLNFIPGGLGIREAIAGALLGILSFDAAAGVVITLADRAVVTFWILLVGVIFNWLLFGSFSLKPKKTKLIS